MTAQVERYIHACRSLASTWFLSCLSGIDLALERSALQYPHESVPFERARLELARCSALMERDFVQCVLQEMERDFLIVLEPDRGLMPGRAFREGFYKHSTHDDNALDREQRVLMLGMALPTEEAFDIWNARHRAIFGGQFPTLDQACFGPCRLARSICIAFHRTRLASDVRRLWLSAGTKVFARRMRHLHFLVMREISSSQYDPPQLEQPVSADMTSVQSVARSSC